MNQINLPADSINTSMKGFITLAKTGHYPLFFEEWMEGSLKEAKPISFSSANRNVKNLFKKLSTHRTVEKKKTMLISLSSAERDEFIRSFFKVVERDILKDLKSLH